MYMQKIIKRRPGGGVSATLHPRDFASLAQLELGNRSCRVGFVFVSNLNGLRNPQPEPNPFIKRVENLDLYPFNF